ncbi:hypothetical protein [Aeromicrobium sp. Leaf291]|uniref:hypothetical protein n=1 Tax=Aeromicrobium sp. Leaf291 TaxID=1736325 RepID=UPI0006F3810D|nr:hypothetical protein [Aeromicrobium sp. Leaf291]KQP83767.1 hypothetical protein ASF35_01950 [Aeromicrobium sp. Leaf291]
MRVTIEKKTDQLNFEDFLGGVTRTVTIVEVRKGTKEQQYDIAIEGDRRVWRPSVTVLKLLVEAWGDDATQWVGRRATLYGDPTVMFGPDRVGGIRVSHVSHIDKPVTANLTKTRGKRMAHTVQPLMEAAPAPTEPTAEQVAACTDPATLRAWWKTSGPDRRAQIEARGAELEKPADEPEQGLNFPEGGA